MVLRGEYKYISPPRKVMKFVLCPVFIGCELKAASFAIFFCMIFLNVRISTETPNANKKPKLGKILFSCVTKQCNEHIEI